MNHANVTPEERFAVVVGEMLSYSDITPPADGTRGRKEFGSSALKVRNKIFAMLIGGRLVVKLPKARVDALVASGNGERFDPKKNGHVMKEWLVLDPASDEEWLPLATEAMTFVGAGA
ncbi:MAG TPA: TfoX/Sxy family protein [Ktedonobacteraceae bacterium]|nr:TfoX/Sxy family protein [Ktedonobacteraceae bacterium]